MKIKFLFFFFFLFRDILFAQIGNAPSIFILAPYEVKYDVLFEKEILLINNEIKEEYNYKKFKKFLTSKEFENLDENLKLISIAEIEFLKTLNIFTKTSFNSERYLTNFFYSKFPQLSIILSEMKCNGELLNLQNFPGVTNFQYIINYPKIEIYKENGTSYANIAVQLFDVTTKKILINQNFIGDWTNPGLDFACKDSTIECCLNNALSLALDEIINKITSNIPELINEQNLSIERSNILKSSFLIKQYDKTFIKNVISDSETDINILNQFQCLFNSDSTKFISFFIMKSDNSNDYNQKPFSLDSTEKESNLYFSYAVVGVLFNKKWFYKPTTLIYFQANSEDQGKEEYFDNLKNWGFFIDNSVEVNKNFWESNFFATNRSVLLTNELEVTELKNLVTKSKDKTEIQAYKEALDNFYKRDQENKEFEGLPEIVAYVLKEDKRKKDDEIKNQIKTQILSDFYENYNKTSKINRIVKIYAEEFNLYYSTNFSFVLSPIVIDNGKEKLELELNYVVLINDSIKGYQFFIWNYFKPKKIERNSMKQYEVYLQIGGVIEDKDFWYKYVLVRENNKYKYLTQVF